MKTMPPGAALALLMAAFLAVMFGLYALLTRKRRAEMREIRQGANARGWNFRMRHWMGDPTAFRIDGRSRNGMSFVARSGGTRGHDRGWTVVLGIRFLELAGEPDVALFPRGAGGRDVAAMSSGISAELKAKVAAFSALAAGAMELMRSGKEVPSGVAEFDMRYRLIVLPGRVQGGLVTEELAGRILQWPAATVPAHSILAWRDPFGFHVQLRLPAPANWATICNALGIAEDLAARVPAGAMMTAPRGVVDRVLAWFAER